MVASSVDSLRPHRSTHLRNEGAMRLMTEARSWGVFVRVRMCVCGCVACVWGWGARLAKGVGRRLMRGVQYVQQ